MTCSHRTWEGVPLIHFTDKNAALAKSLLTGHLLREALPDLLVKIVTPTPTHPNGLHPFAYIILLQSTHHHLAALCVFIALCLFSLTSHKSGQPNGSVPNSGSAPMAQTPALPQTSPGARYFDHLCITYPIQVMIERYLKVSCKG